jgi:hypothetical protein
MDVHVNMIQVELNWRADSQMAEASQSSSGDTAVSHGAEAGGGMQLSNPEVTAALAVSPVCLPVFLLVQYILPG